MPEATPDGTILTAATGFGSKPPARLGTRELAKTESGCGEVRPGMIVAGGPVIDAFARIGWEWGGDWNQSKDHQHFSRTGL